jgi:hypothetical protein
MENHLIFVYSAYFFTFLVLILIGINFFLAFNKSNKKISSFKNNVKNKK